MITKRGSGRVRALVAATVLALGAGTLVGCGNGSAESAPPAASAIPAQATPVRATPAPPIDLGKGLLAFPGETQAWVAAHPSDPRTPLIRSRISTQPSNLWLTGDESFGNLRRAVDLARRGDRTMLLTIYDIPGRDDGLSAPSTVSLARYRAWIDRVVAIIGTTRAVVVLEPDALWFYDRLANDTVRHTRVAALTYALGRFQHAATRTRVYLEAGTASGSVTPARMAALLWFVGVRYIAGYAVNVSSYAPGARIDAYAQGIRAGLQAHHLADPRYVVDTGRNGASRWDNTWCNPTAQRLGASPRLVRSTTGLDLDLWVKAPGTSDGDCGPVGGGSGSYGGQFLPAVAYRMITG